ncbi:hypothetical protein [Providencia rettgeri]|uniref:hypothetical protein n=1 Tax=Providencia rettgeri TaxID=587 RepID=UPI002045B7D9|nr:hypothetical protein [Providencia rettgeri]UPS64106.1 hypothetical protein M0M83_06155 [Providencia rettgeri]
MPKPIQNSNITQTMTHHVSKNTSKSSKGISGRANNVSNNNQECPVTTSEKTVHKKDITKLNNNVTAGLSKIKSKLDAILSDKISAPFQNNVINELKVELKALTTSVNNYQNKLNSSSYAHNSSKQKTITTLETKLSTVTGKMSKAERNNQFNVIRDKQVLLDNTQKASDLSQGKKTPSKFDDQ